MSASKRSTAEILKEQEQLAERNREVERRRAERIKALRKKVNAEDKKTRNHMLIVLGATISGVFGKDYLSDAEIDQVRDCIKAILGGGYVILKEPQEDSQDEQDGDEISSAPEPVTGNGTEQNQNSTNDDIDDWMTKDNFIL